MPYITHQMSYTRFYRIFRGAQSRCNRPANKDYARYGGRGIKFLWSNFEEFKLDMESSFVEAVKKFGEKNTTLDRKDNYGPYSKENCHWSTYQTQALNRRNNNRISFHGKTMTAGEWARELGINVYTLRTRLHRKMPLEKALVGKIYRKNHV